MLYKLLRGRCLVNHGNIMTLALLLKYAAYENSIGRPSVVKRAPT